jgi:hypothetical protein
MRHFICVGRVTSFAILAGCSAGAIDGGADVAGSSSGSSGSASANSGNPSSGSVQPGQGGTGGASANGGWSANAGGAPAMMPAPAVAGGPGCGLAAAAFCDNFETPSPGGRAGDLDETKWSIARVAQYVAPPGFANAWPPSVYQGCGTTTDNVFPDKDHTFCLDSNGNRLLGQTFNDSGQFGYFSMRPRQPFDFAGRTGTVALDVDLRTPTPTGHGYWIEFMVTDQPVPGPYQGSPGTDALPRNGFAIQFDFPGCFNPGFEAPGDQYTETNVINLIVFKNYAVSRTYTGGDLKDLKCIKGQDGVMSHVELKVSQDTIEVWASDAGKPDTFRRIAMREGVALPFTRGYVQVEHVHYNAPKGGLPAYKTYHFDNIGFDGPVLPTPRAYEVADSLTMGGQNTVSTGYVPAPNPPTAAPKIFTLDGVDLTGAASASLDLNLWGFVPTTNVQFRVNGGAPHKIDHPYPDTDQRWRTHSLPVPLSELHQGSNTLEFITSQGNLVLANIGLTVEL